MELIEEITHYKPFNEQEEKDKALFLECLQKEENLFLRENRRIHMTASCWIVNSKFDKVLFCYHNIYHSWAWLGGHSDGNENLLEVALKEAREESGLEKIYPYDKVPFSIESLPVSGHIKKGEYVSSHIHLNVTYLLVADEEEELRINKEENSGLKWFSFSDALKASCEPWMVQNIYKKLIKKVECCVLTRK